MTGAAEEEAFLRDSMRSLLVEASSPEQVARIADGDDQHDEALWRRLRDELGVCGLLIPEGQGGVDAGWHMAGAVVGELGRMLACVPYVSSCVVAATALLDLAVEEPYLPAIAAGEVIATVAMTSPRGTLNRDLLGVTCAPGTRGSRVPASLTGVVHHVVDGPLANLFLVLADVNGEPGWFAVERGAAGLDVESMAVLDATRPMATLALRDVPALPVGQDEDAWEVAEHVLDAALVALSCEQAAAAAYLVQRSAEYATTRIQFGRPIGSFQAVQHHLANLHVLADRARSASDLAVDSMSAGGAAAREAASLAAVVCGEAMRTVAAETIHVHGGIGFTWEHFAHRYFRRAHASLVAFGSPDVHRERLLKSIGV